MQAAAALSFYSLLSLAPLVIVVVAMAGIFFSDIEVRSVLILRISELISEDTAALVQTIIENTADEEQNVSSLIIGGMLMLVGASTAFAHLHTILNRVWNVNVSGRKTLLQILKGRLWSFAFLFVIAALLVASLLLSTLFTAVDEWLHTRAIDAPNWADRTDFAISYGLTTLLIAAIYKLLPDAKVPWRGAFLGAVVSTLLFDGSKALIQYYVTRFDPASSFGAAGSVIAFMVWIYIASLIVLVGAEISRAEAIRRSGAEA